jgi:molecular chaperone GrpE
MVKKKLSETEKGKEKNKIENTENKDNKVDLSVDTEVNSGMDEETKTDEKREDTESGEGALSDKKIPVEAQLIEKLAEMQDKYLRLSAEFDNYRKRTLKEKIEMSKYAGEDLLKDILTFMDDFERALKHIEISENCTAIKEGIDLIYVKMSDFLKQHGVKEIESLNTNFDVDLHDAVAKIPVEEEDKKGKIVEVISKGYYLKDKVLRHSKVVIGE